MPARHWSSGFRLITVSNISTGAGSVAVAARPALPNTDSTSGKRFNIWSWVCSSSADLVIDSDGRRRRHEQQRTFVEHGHEFAAQLQCGIHGYAQRDQGDGDGEFFQRITQAMTGR
jgi:hypothetical protein